MAKASSSIDGKKLGMLALALLCLGAAGYMVYRNFAEDDLPPLPAVTPEEAKPSEPAPLPPNVKRPTPG